MGGPSFCHVVLVVMMIVQLDCVIGNVQDLRLIGGQTPNEGRVEVQWRNKRRSRWFVVCEKGWNNDDSSAACRQLGYTEGGEASNRNIRRGSLRFFRRKFNCKEDSVLSDCGTGNVKCGKKHKTAKVICHGNRSPRSTTSTTTTLLSPGPGYKPTVMLNTTNTTDEQSLTDSTTPWPVTTIGTTIETTFFEYLMTDDATQGTATAGSKGQTPSPQKHSQRFPIVPVAASLGTVLGLLLLLAVLLFIICRRRRARSQEDNMTAKLDNDTDQVGMGELGTGQCDDDEHNYHTIQDPAINSKGLPVIPTAPPSEQDENYSTIPDLLSDRVDERAPAPPPSQTDVYYSVVRDSGTASAADQAGPSETAKTTQEPEYAVVDKKASKRKETNKEESDDAIDQGTGADVPEYSVVNKIKKKVEGKVDDECGTVENVIYQPS